MADLPGGCPASLGGGHGFPACPGYPAAAGEARRASGGQPDNHPGFHPPEATYLAWLNCRELAPGDALWQTILDKGRLAVNDGRELGPGGDGYVRLNFATSRRILNEVLHRLERALTP